MRVQGFSSTCVKSRIIWSRTSYLKPWSIHIGSETGTIVVLRAHGSFPYTSFPYTSRRYRSRWFAHVFHAPNDNTRRHSLCFFVDEMQLSRSSGGEIKGGTGTARLSQNSVPHIINMVLGTMHIMLCTCIPQRLRAYTHELEGLGSPGYRIASLV